MSRLEAWFQERGCFGGGGLHRSPDSYNEDFQSGMILVSKMIEDTSKEIIKEIQKERYLIKKEMHTFKKEIVRLLKEKQ